MRKRETLSALDDNMIVCCGVLPCYSARQYGLWAQRHSQHAMHPLIVVVLPFWRVFSMIPGHPHCEEFAPRFSVFTTVNRKRWGFSKMILDPDCRGSWTQLLTPTLESDYRDYWLRLLIPILDSDYTVPRQGLVRRQNVTSLCWRTGLGTRSRLLSRCGYACLCDAVAVRVVGTLRKQLLWNWRRNRLTSSRA